MSELSNLLAAFEGFRRDCAHQGVCTKAARELVSYLQTELARYASRHCHCCKHYKPIPDAPYGDCVSRESFVPPYWECADYEEKK